MSEQKMTPEQEEKLFGDVDELRREFSKSNTTIALIEQQITYLVSAVKEMKSFATEEELEVVKMRLKVLEDEKIVRETIEGVSHKNKTWWSNNWYKVFGVIVICMPSFIALYNLINAPAKG